MRREDQATSSLEYELNDGIEYLTDYISREMGRQNPPFVVLIGAGSSAGKGEVVKRLLEKFAGDAAYLPLDDYYFGEPFMSQKIAAGKSYLNWDHPEAVDLDLAEKHVEALLSGQSIAKPLYSLKTGMRHGEETIESRRLIIVEGNFALLHEGLRDLAKLTIFVEAKMHTRLSRRLLRDVQRTSMSPYSILKYFVETVEPMHRRFIEPTKRYAGVVIKNEFVPEVESLRAGMLQDQYKFTGTITAESLRKAGASHLASVEQADNYYIPKDYDLLLTGETMRIRQEGGHFKFSMKGPKHGPGLHRRSKFEFRIDERAAEAFTEIYGKAVCRIGKVRHLHVLDGIIVAVDLEVTKVMNGYQKSLGDFIEICSTHGGTISPGELKAVVTSLGFDPQKAELKSYFEM